MAESEVKYQSEISVGGIQSQETLINSLKDRITSLQATLKAYKKTIDAQNTKIASNDKMFIDYTSFACNKSESRNHNYRKNSVERKKKVIHKKAFYNFLIFLLSRFELLK